MKTDFPFLVQWSEGPADKRLTWWLKRSVKPNSYYGEVTDWARRLQIGLEGPFVESDLTTVQQLIQDMRQLGSQTATDSNGDGYALLALGTRAKPDILFRYCKGSEATNDTARLFLRIIEILRKYVESSLNSAKSA
jgi:hypothetical protein